MFQLFGLCCKTSPGPSLTSSEQSQSYLSVLGLSPQFCPPNKTQFSTFRLHIFFQLTILPHTHSQPYTLTHTLFSTHTDDNPPTHTHLGTQIHTYSHKYIQPHTQTHTHAVLYTHTHTQSPYTPPTSCRKCSLHPLFILPPVPSATHFLTCPHLSVL